MTHLTDEELFRLLDGECSAEEKHIFEAHLHTCAACMASYKDLGAIDLQLQQLTIESPSLDFTEKLMDKLQVAPVAQRKSQQKTYLLMLAPFGVVFVVSMLLLAGYAAGWLTFGSGTETIPFQFQLPSVNLQPLLENSWLVNLFLLVNAALALLLLDKAVLQPFFRKRFNRVVK